VIFDDPVDELIMLDSNEGGKCIVADVILQHPVALYRAFMLSVSNVIHHSFFKFHYWTLHVLAKLAIFRYTGCYG
jgi:hypothetical protein